MPDHMTEPQPLAVCRSYEEMRAAIATWCAEIGMTRADLDAAAGLADGHSSKLLTKRQIKRMGPRTIGPVLGATGLVLIVAVDPDAVDHRKHPRKNPDDANQIDRAKRRKGAGWSRRMNSRRWFKLSAERRKDIAQKAARARWNRAKSSIQNDGFAPPPKPSRNHRVVNRRNHARNRSKS